MNQVLNKLKSEGWYINELKFTNHIKDLDLQLNYVDIKNYLLNTDMKYYGDSWINNSNKSEFQCLGVFQINKIKNVAAPEIDQDNKNLPTLLKFTITDGISSVFLLDLQSNSKLSRLTEPGCKIIFNGSAMFKSGMVILFDKVNVQCLGGKVHDLIRAESIQKSTKTHRTTVTGNSRGPPKFTPFGNKLNINVQEIRKFKAMQPEDVNDTLEEANTDFGDKREAALAQIRKTKQTDSKVVLDKNTLLDKFHGGGTSKFVKETFEKQDQNDSNVAYLLSSGFSFAEVKRSLKATNNDVNAALDHLLNKRIDPPERESRGRGRRGGRGRGRNCDDEDESWFDPAQYAAKVGLASRPNTTISLAELMGTRPISESRPDNNSVMMIRRGYQCLAQVMDGSYEAAVVLEVLPGKYLRIQYVSSAETIETNVGCLKTMSGEKVSEHMVPNVISEKRPERQSANYGYNNDTGHRDQYSGYRGRGGGSGHAYRRRREGRYGNS